ncbi:MAG: hypothetical protein JXR94_10790 [Candidatus Hydrogenedentes bacterium]|nr:hypothetical protein [Candidatus Hydrogenedentota bacterium]
MKVARTFLILALLVALGACKPPPPVPKTDRPDGGAGAEGEAPPVVELNIGDVEQGIDIQARLAPESASATITAEELGNKRDQVMLLTLKVSPPYPEELWVEYRVNAKRAFAERPVALRARVLVEREREIGSFSLVLGADARKNGFAKKIDILSGLEAIPETMEVIVSAEAFMMPAGTDEETLDPETAVSDESSKAIYQTAVRVNFEPEAAAAAEGAGDESS